MTIVFAKVGQTAKPFDLKHKEVEFKGSLEKSGYHRVKLDAHLQGEVKLQCDRCGDTYAQSVNVPLTLTLSDQVIETEDDLDIIEFTDGVIDLDFIVESEIASLESAYNYCSQCQDSQELFEKEF
ncbi:MAG TPA: DUF177 domain-containing protein [Campylobacterales bacterium]|nr:DUF177 domain-containing protein [Campylobacterales bacterium]